jgi:hypothetical protein
MKQKKQKKPVTFTYVGFKTSADGAVVGFACMTGAHLKLLDQACGLEPSTVDSNGSQLIDAQLYEVTKDGIVPAR